MIKQLFIYLRLDKFGLFTNRKMDAFDVSTQESSTAAAVMSETASTISDTTSTMVDTASSIIQTFNETLMNTVQAILATTREFYNIQ